MIIYGASISPFVRKAVAFAREKDLDFEHQQVPPHNDDPDFKIASPLGRIPGMKDGDFGLGDSTAIIHYLERKHPDPALLGTDAESHGRIVFFDKFSDTVMVANAMGPIFFNRVAYRFFGVEPDTTAADVAEKDKLPDIVAFIEASLADGRDWLVGDTISLADISVASPFKNLEYAQAAIDWDAYPKTRAHLDRVFARDSFAELIAADKALIGG